MTYKYDESNPLSIKDYADKLIGKTFYDVLESARIDVDEKLGIITKANNPRYKGSMGHLIEEYYFEYKINSDQEPDFPKAGVELKVTPYEVGKKGGYKAGERLVITMINYNQPVEDNFYSSHVYKKFRYTLLIHYLRNRSLNRLDYPINYVTLFSPPQEDLEIIKQDYEKIISKIKEGKAHELSEGDTMYLGACTKGANSIKGNVIQEYYAPSIEARTRAFCFKQSYMTYILNKYSREKIETYEPIIQNIKELEEKRFEDIIVDKINLYRGYSDEDLSEIFDVKKGILNFWSALSYRILGVKSNRAEEFLKADIEVKAIRIEENGRMRESISFPTVSFKEFIEEEWEESKLYNQLSSKKYLFVLFKKEGLTYTLKGCQLWNMSNKDLQEASLGWLRTKEIVKGGVILKKKYKKDGINFEVTNNFPSKKENRVIHIRPHSSKRYYNLNDGEIIGENRNHGDELPDGRIMTKQCFWLNNSYILTQIDNKILD